MLFLQFSNITVYVRVVGKMKDHHFNLSLFSNRGDMVQKRWKTTGQNLSPTFNKNQDLVPWIEGQRCIEMLVRYFSTNPDICDYDGKLPKQHFNAQMFSNPGYKILICDVI